MKLRSKTKQSPLKIINIARGPIKLKPTQVHKSKKAYSRKKEKARLKRGFNMPKVKGTRLRLSLASARSA